MKRTTSLLLCLLTANVVLAQDTEEPATTPLVPKERKTELGVMSETSFGNSYALTVGLAGIQYKRWVKPDMGYRVIAAYGQYEDFGRPSIINKIGDTVIESYRKTRVPMAFIGGGIERQRHFYKRVYLFAAIEARAGYGTGSYDTSITKRVDKQEASYNSFTSGTKYNGVDLFSLSVTPSIGAKLQFKKVCVGTELSAITAEYRYISYPNSNSSGVNNFDAGTFRQRFFVHFRF